jgi:hypothetical protein
MDTAPHQPPDPNAGTPPVVTSPPAVRIKVYGLISLTRQGYLRFLAAGGVLLVVLFVLWAVVIARLPLHGEAGSVVEVLWTMLRNYMPLLLLLAALLEAIEAAIVLGRFRRAEAQRQAGAHEVNSEGK